MAADILTREQLLAQLARREAFLLKCKADGASERMVRKLEKDIRLTLLRLERMKVKTE